MANRDREYREVQIAKALHMLASGTHWTRDRRIRIRSKFPSSSGLVLRELGRMVDDIAGLVAEQAAPEVLAIMRERKERLQAARLAKVPKHVRKLQKAWSHPLPQRPAERRRAAQFAAKSVSGREAPLVRASPIGPQKLRPKPISPKAPSSQSSTMPSLCRPSGLFLASLQGREDDGPPLLTYSLRDQPKASPSASPQASPPATPQASAATEEDGDDEETWTPQHEKFLGAAQGSPLASLAHDLSLHLQATAGHTFSPHKGASSNWLASIENVLANLFLNPAGLSIGTANIRRTRCDRPRVFHNLRLLLDDLANLGLIFKVPYLYRQRRTTTAPTPKLNRLFDAFGVASSHIVRIEGEETITVDRHGIRTPFSG